MRKILLLSALAIGLAIFTIRADADEAVRSAQAQLQSAGYYTGPVDGQLNAETKAALRRYQIRNELEPSGELTPETTAALSKEQPSVPATPAATPIPPPLQPSVPTVPQPPSAARGIPVPSAEAEPDVYGGFYSRTPYAEAPREIQHAAQGSGDFGRARSLSGSDKWLARPRHRRSAHPISSPTRTNTDGAARSRHTGGTPFTASHQTPACARSSGRV